MGRLRILILALAILYAPSACAACLPFAKAKETFNPPYHYKVDGRHRCWYGKLRKVVMPSDTNKLSTPETPPLPAPVSPEGAKVVNLGDRFTDSLGRPVDVSAVIAERFLDPVPPVKPPEPQRHLPPLWVWMVWIGVALIGFGSILLAAVPMRRDTWAPTRALPMGEE